MYSNYQIPLANNHISVDCVVLGFDGKQLKVLLLKRDLCEIEGSGDYEGFEKFTLFGETGFNTIQNGIKICFPTNSFYNIEIQLLFVETFYPLALLKLLF